jgi:hypothetical protein
MLPVKYELRSYGDKINGPMHYFVDGMEVTKEEYYLAWKENNKQ